MTYRRNSGHQLPELLRSLFDRLSLPAAHGPLVEPALAYLVSARYGLVETELLEILLRDPDYRHKLIAGAARPAATGQTDSHCLMVPLALRPGALLDRARRSRRQRAALLPSAGRQLRGRAVRRDAGPALPVASAAGPLFQAAALVARIARGAAEADAASLQCPPRPCPQDHGTARPIVGLGPRSEGRRSFERNRSGLRLD